MASESKEINILKLILENSPLKEWHFEEIVKKSNVTKAVANKWLKKYVKEKLIYKIKEKKKFPYFTVGNNNFVYYSYKRIFALNQFHNSGLISELLSLNEAKTIILFGSMIKGDWYKNSDIDIFILGKHNKLKKNLFEKKLFRKIEIHSFKNIKELKKIKTGLIRNIINGFLIKGNINDLI